MAHSSSFAGLREAIHNEEYEKCAEIAADLSKELPDDPEVAKCEAVALIHLGKYAACLAALEAKQRPVAEALVFEKAYALYQLNRLADALKVIAGADRAGGADSHALRTLEAQILHRHGRCGEAAELYTSLIEENEAANGQLDEAELVSNALASYTLSGRGAEGLVRLETRAADFLEEEDLDENHEVAYNAACACLDGGSLARAVALLDLADARLEHATSKAEVQEEAEAEAAPLAAAGSGPSPGAKGAKGGASKPPLSEEAAAILAQRAYALLRQSVPGSSGAAQAMLLCLKVIKALAAPPLAAQEQLVFEDHAVVAVAANNLAVVRRDREVFDSHKRLKAAATEATEGKMSASQVAATRLNKCLLLLNMGKVDESAAAAEALVLLDPANAKPRLVLLSIKLQSPGADRAAIAAEALALAGGGQQGTSEGAADFGPDARTDLRLFAAQVWLDCGDPSKACGALEAVRADPQARKAAASPALVATIIDLKERMGDSGGAAALLDEACEAAEAAEASSSASSSSSTGGTQSASALLLGAAGWKVSRGSFQAAAELYDRALGQSQGDAAGDESLRVSVRAQRVVALSYLCPESEAFQDAQDALPPLDRFARGDEEGEEEEEESGEALADRLETAQLPKRSSRVKRLVVVDKASARAERKKATVQKSHDGETAADGEHGGGGQGGGQGQAGSKARRRLKQREAYLAKLTADGKYNPNRPLAPDPERWLPKKLRGRRGRGGFSRGAGKAADRMGCKFSGAQGVGEGAVKDAAKLDAYARAQAKKEADAKAAEEPETQGKRGPWKRLK